MARRYPRSEASGSRSQAKPNRRAGRGESGRGLRSPLGGGTPPPRKSEAVASPRATMPNTEPKAPTRHSEVAEGECPQFPTEKQHTMKRTPTRTREQRTRSSTGAPRTCAAVASAANGGTTTSKERRHWSPPRMPLPYASLSSWAKNPKKRGWRGGDFLRLFERSVIFSPHSRRTSDGYAHEVYHSQNGGTSDRRASEWCGCSRTTSAARRARVATSR